MPNMDRRGFVCGSAALLAAADGSRVEAGRRTMAVDVRSYEYARPGGTILSLDLYKPAGTSHPLPVILFVHGGAWMFGDRTAAPDLRRYFADAGFAMASIDYRLAPDVTFPSNLEDVLTAIRWLRANAKLLGLDTDRLGLWGTSAGGHLASLAGLVPAGSFAGTGNLGQSSAVRCVLDGYGPTALALQEAQLAAEKPGLDPLSPAIANFPVPARNGPKPPFPPNTALLGAPVEQVPEKVRAANPITYVSSDAPPFLIMHGLADDIVPHGQSQLLYEALVRSGTDATLRLVHGVPHSFFNMPGIDEAAGPFRMEVRHHQPGKGEVTGADSGFIFDVARAFFQRHLM